MSSNRSKGCDEYHRLSRRSFVGLSASAVAAGATPSWLPRVVLADSEDSDRDVLVSIFLRGGCDALTLCVPFTEKNYYSSRPTQAIAPPDSRNADRAIALDGRFGFPPALKALKAAYDAEDLLLVHACGLKESNRSHFDAMYFMEVGQVHPPGDLFTGWLGRHLQVAAPTARDAVLRAVGIGYGLQRTLVGGPRTLPIADLADFGLAGQPGTGRDRRKALDAMYSAFGNPLAASAENTLSTIELLERIEFDDYRPAGGAAYPDTDLGTALRSTAALIKADVGVEAAAIDLGGWDTHEDQSSTDGWLAWLMRNLARSLAAFHDDLFSSNRSDVVVVATSEFGRNVFENGSGGTDHGYGGLMLVLGGAVGGGRVLTDWPGLARGQLFEAQDLRITIDYRDVITEILGKRLGNADFRTVFPDAGYRPTDRGVIA